MVLRRAGVGTRLRHDVGTTFLLNGKALGDNNFCTRGSTFRYDAGVIVRW
jgi:hypothetical protein